MAICGLSRSQIAKGKKMIKPYYSIFGRTVPSYGIFICIGILLATLVAITICKRKGTERYEIVYSGIYTGIGGFLGAKLLFILVSLPQIIANHIPFWAVMMGGFVFYGGLMGGALGMYIYCKQFKVDIVELVETYATVLPLAHVFGRVGCFFAGCCYGIEYNGFFSYTYTSTLGVTPIGVPLLPIQLIEALGLVIIFAIELWVYIKTKKKRGYSLVIYMISKCISAYSKNICIFPIFLTQTFKIRSAYYGSNLYAGRILKPFWGIEHIVAKGYFKIISDAIWFLTVFYDFSKKIPPCGVYRISFFVFSEVIHFVRIFKFKSERIKMPFYIVGKSVCIFSENAANRTFAAIFSILKRFHFFFAHIYRVIFKFKYHHYSSFTVVHRFLHKTIIP